MIGSSAHIEDRIAWLIRSSSVGEKDPSLGRLFPARDTLPVLSLSYLLLSSRLEYAPRQPPSALKRHDGWAEYSQAAAAGSSPRPSRSFGCGALHILVIMLDSGRFPAAIVQADLCRVQSKGPVGIGVCVRGRHEWPSVGAMRPGRLYSV